MGEDDAAAAAEESKKTVYVAPSDGGAPGLVKTSLQFQSHKKAKTSIFPAGLHLYVRCPTGLLPAVRLPGRRPAARRGGGGRLGRGRGRHRRQETIPVPRLHLRPGGGVRRPLHPGHRLVRLLLPGLRRSLHRRRRGAGLPLAAHEDTDVTAEKVPG